MSTKTISIKEEAYKRLKKIKGENKSFSDVILELTEKTEKDFSNIIGAEINIKWKQVKEDRQKAEEDEKREKLLSGH